MFFIDCFLHRLGTLIFRILVPTWPQLAPQLGAQIHPKSFQEPSKIDLKWYLVSDASSDRFLMDLGWIWGRFGEGFGMVLGGLGELNN